MSKKLQKLMREGWKDSTPVLISSKEDCEKTLLTTDGQGREKKTVALYYLLSGSRSSVAADYTQTKEDLRKAKMRIFLMETKLQEYREDRRKWLDGEDNPELRLQNKLLRDELAASKSEIARLNGVLKPVKSIEKTALCFYCEQKLGITKDHFIPQSKGGGQGINIVMACHQCNCKKGDRLPSELQIKRFLTLWKKLGIDLSKYMQIVVDEEKA